MSALVWYVVYMLMYKKYLLWMLDIFWQSGEVENCPFLIFNEMFYNTDVCFEYVFQ